MTTAHFAFALFAQQGGGVDRAASGLAPWFTPIWTISAGVLLGLIAVAAIYGLAAAFSRNAEVILQEMILKGLLQLIFYVTLVPAVIAVLGFYWAPYKTAFSEPESSLLYGSAAFILSLFLLAVALRLIFPKMAAIALTTFKEGMGQPLFWVCITVGGFLLLLFVWVPYNTFGEDIKMLKTQGLELLMAIAVLLGVATASVSVSDEIEGRTALTVLSKPIGRRQFIVGKFIGVMGPVLLMFLVLGFIFLGTVSYKVIYDGAEAGKMGLTVDQCRTAVVTIIPGIGLRFLEAMMLASISVAIATRLPMLANLSICFVIFAVGHLAPMLAQISDDRNEIVQFMGQLIATVVPVLEHFDIQAGIADNQSVPLIYLATVAVYSLLVCTFFLLGALFLFEDRDLA